MYYEIHGTDAVGLVTRRGLDHQSTFGRILPDLAKRHRWLPLSYKLTGIPRIWIVL